MWFLPSTFVAQWVCVNEVASRYHSVNINNCGFVSKCTVHRYKIDTSI